MNKNLLIIGAVAVIVLAIGGYWLYFGRDRGQKESAPSETPQEESFVGKIADALKLGKAMKCTWSGDEGTATFHIKGNQYRGEVTSEEGKVNYIMRGNCIYVWQEGEEEGLKWCWTSEEAEEWTEDFEGEASGAALGYQYSCQATVISDSLFTLPSGVEFMDLSDFQAP